MLKVYSITIDRKSMNPNMRMTMAKIQTSFIPSSPETVISEKGITSFRGIPEINVGRYCAFGNKKRDYTNITREKTDHSRAQVIKQILLTISDQKKKNGINKEDCYSYD